LLGSPAPASPPPAAAVVSEDSESSMTIAPPMSERLDVGFFWKGVHVVGNVVASVAAVTAVNPVYLSVGLIASGSGLPPAVAPAVKIPTTVLKATKAVKTVAKAFKAAAVKSVGKAASVVKTATGFVCQLVLKVASNGLVTGAGVVILLMIVGWFVWDVKRKRWIPTVLKKSLELRQAGHRLEELKAEELRQTGNRAVNLKSYQAAIDAYTEALSSGSLSPALAAVLYCNRAAAHQGLGNRALAVADCCRAKALHPGYAKAHSRLAALFTELGMHSSAVDELNAAIAVDDGVRKSWKSFFTVTSTSLAEYQTRLRAAKEAAAPRLTFYGATMNPPPANHYKVLGLEKDCAAEEVRKSYRKLALQLHPDKDEAVKLITACRLSFNLCESSGTGGSELTELAAATQKRLEEGASWVFQCLGAANETLSAPEKRIEFDAELSAWECSFGGGAGGDPRYYHSPRGHRQQYQQHSEYTSYGAYYPPHAHPSYDFIRNQYGSRSSGCGAGGFYRYYWY